MLAIFLLNACVGNSYDVDTAEEGAADTVEVLNEEQESSFEPPAEPTLLLSCHEQNGRSLPPTWGLILGTATADSTARQRILADAGNVLDEIVRMSNSEASAAAAAAARAGRLRKFLRIGGWLTLAVEVLTMPGGNGDDPCFSMFARVLTLTKTLRIGQIQQLLQSFASQPGHRAKTVSCEPESFDFLQQTDSRIPGTPPCSYENKAFDWITRRLSRTCQVTESRRPDAAFSCLRHGMVQTSSADRTMATQLPRRAGNPDELLGPCTFAKPIADNRGRFATICLEENFASYPGGPTAAAYEVQTMTSVHDIQAGTNRFVYPELPPFRR